MPRNENSVENFNFFLLFKFNLYDSVFSFSYTASFKNGGEKMKIAVRFSSELSLYVRY